MHVILFHSIQSIFFCYVYRFFDRWSLKVIHESFIQKKKVFFSLPSNFSAWFQVCHKKNDSLKTLGHLIIWNSFDWVLAYELIDSNRILTKNWRRNRSLVVDIENDHCVEWEIKLMRNVQRQNDLIFNSGFVFSVWMND